MSTPSHHPRGPRELSARWVEAALCLRRKHPPWGPRKLRAALQREHPRALLPAVMSLWRQLHKAGLIGPRRVRTLMKVCLGTLLIGTLHRDDLGGVRPAPYQRPSMPEKRSLRHSGAGTCRIKLEPSTPCFARTELPRPAIRSGRGKPGAHPVDRRWRCVKREWCQSVNNPLVRSRNACALGSLGPSGPGCTRGRTCLLKLCFTKPGPTLK